VLHRYLRLTPLLLLAACPKEEPPDPVDSDSDVIDPDPVVPDLDGTIPEATTLPAGAWAEPTELASDALNPAGDNDFYTVELAANQPYHLWVDTGANLLCDTVLRLYPPGSTTPATVTIDPTTQSTTRDNGDLFAANDDMIFRMSGSDPGLVFVPPTGGRWLVEILEYHESVGESPDGGEFCTYALWAWERASAEVECNDTTEVITALESLVDGTPGYPLDAVTPATQPLGDNRFLAGSEEFTGWRVPGDDDVWQFRFGDFFVDEDDLADTDVRPDPSDPEVDTDDVYQWDLSHFSTKDYAMWQWSTWPTNEGQTSAGHRLELLNANMEVVASTNRPGPDGNHGFATDPGILYRVTSGSTWYLRVTDLPSAVAPRGVAPGLGTLRAGPEGQGQYYVGVSHGFGPNITACAETENEANWLEQEHAGGDGNDNFDRAQLLRFCQVGSTDVYGSYTAGFAKPTGLDFKFVRADPPDDEEAPQPQVFFTCGSPGACPDEDYYTIRPTSGAKKLADARITISVQAATIGSNAEFEVFLFINNDRVYPVAWTPGGTPSPEFTLAEPDRVLQTTIPTEATSVAILVQPRTFAPTTRENPYFMRVIIESPDDGGE
jgi:hypothetical protein